MALSGQKRAFEERASEDASCSTSESAGALEEQLAERHYIMRVDDRFDGERYRVIKQLGKGTFGRVVEMWDEQEHTHVAVKVVRAVEKYSREAEIEAEILLAVQKDAALDLPIGRLMRSFSSQGHRCLVFGKLGPSLYHALRGVKREAERRSRGKALHAGRFFSLAAISRVALDCFRALAHLHAIKLAHTDLKPENVLFTAAGRPDVSSGTAGVAIIDFGGATWEHEHHSSIVCTRQYRPAEVTLGAGWDSSVDLWSMGCILAELWTGGVLFSTHDEVEHLALMERSLGSLPPGLVRRASARKMDKNFRHGTLRWPDRAYDRASEAHVRAQPRLKDALRGEPHIAPLRWGPQLADFYDLLWRLLEYEPQDRLSAVDALKHPFVAAAAAMAATPVPEEAPPPLESSASRSADRQPPVPLD